MPVQTLQDAAVADTKASEKPAATDEQKASSSKVRNTQMHAEKDVQLQRNANRTTSLTARSYGGLMSCYIQSACLRASDCCQALAGSRRSTCVRDRMQCPQTAHFPTAAYLQDGSMKQEAEEAAPKMPAKPTLLLRGRRETGGVRA